ncbi:MAG TPA: GNAT family N-acetyltransferase [Acidimicrobiales bacterium]|nr:GNAT family N-acetyltransferase [Acidimicrobiales bacterium]
MGPRLIEVDFRPATAGDLAEEFEVFEVAQRELCERRGAKWTGRDFSQWERLHLHLLRNDGARCFVAEEAGRVVAFTAAWVREDVWFLSALFVNPEQQGRGIGTRLLTLAWGEEYRRRVTITESLQPVSTASYARRGLIPTTPILRFQGRPRSTEPEKLEAAPRDPDALRLLDRAAYGFDRSVDHTLWKKTAETSTLWLSGGEPAAYSYVSTTGLIGPLAGRDETSAAKALRAELARRADRTVSVAIPGSSAQLVEVALASGLRMEDPGLLLLSPPTDPPRTLAIHGDWLL